eukprot:TRINITY_DN7797_c0_g1_i1.p1 TRINITY_DN7797_c0_g1~~TRINITY_DN7797_c0_g1_i1.p1  ORF type:complete len:462 (+),score=67.82 TRINITY_DN7797_c0_g1_i1:92-1477(+)
MNTLTIYILLATVVSVQSDPLFVGCFGDTSASPDMPTETKLMSKEMSLELCVGHCKGKGYRYVALQEGSTCYCGNSYGSHGESRGGCIKECNGGSTPFGRCGGDFANSVYDTTKVQQETSSSNYELAYVGCFKDKSPGRQFPTEFQFDDDSMTVQMCVQHCTKQQHIFSYVALQDGNQCFCGNEPGDKLGRAEGSCTKNCAGTQVEKVPGPAGKCGGPFMNQVYGLRLLVPPTDAPKGGPVGVSTKIVPNCGIPASVLIAAFAVLVTSLGSTGFFSVTVLSATYPSAATSVFIGSLAAEAFLVVISCLIGHILPDSSFLSIRNNKILNAVLLVGYGLLQVHKSFCVASKDLDERRDDFRCAIAEIGQPHQKDGGRQLHEEIQDSPSAVFMAFKIMLLTEWGTLNQLAIIILSIVIDIRSVMHGGLLTYLYLVSIAVIIAPTSVIGKNGFALKTYFAGGMDL